MPKPEDDVNLWPHGEALNETALTPAERSLHNNFCISVKQLRRDLVRSAYYLFQIRERAVHRKLGFATMAT